MRSLSMVASLAALFVITNTVSSFAGSYEQRANRVSYSNHTYVAANASPVSQQQSDAVPPNCLRQECGKLWCWQMKGGASH